MVKQTPGGYNGKNLFNHLALQPANTRTRYKRGGSRLNRFLDVATRAAYQAGEFLLNNLYGTSQVHYKGEGHFNPQSLADKGAEDIIVNIISDAFPNHSFISEERGEIDTPSDYTWVIDPLDGTINFIHKYHCFAVSIALLYREDVMLGAVYNPLVDEMFTAVKGNGAYLNDRRIQTSMTTNLDKSLLAMGFPYDRNSEAFSQSTKNFVCLLRESQAIRRDGSTALDLCNVACGRYDGFCIAGNPIWDYAAGSLIVTESGGKITDFKGNPFHVKNNNNEVLATNGKIHDIILKCFTKVK